MSHIVYGVCFPSILHLRKMPFVHNLSIIVFLLVYAEALRNPGKKPFRIQNVLLTCFSSFSCNYFEFLFPFFLRCLQRQGGFGKYAIVLDGERYLSKYQW